MAFCDPVSMTSMPSSSLGIFIAENELTVSTIETTSGYSLRTFDKAAISLMVPVDVSLCTSVTTSYCPLDSSLFKASGSTGWPHSKLSCAASLPQRFETSNHLSEKAPLQQFNTFFFTVFRIEPSITPQALLVLINTGDLVKKSSCSPGCTDR